MGKIVRTTLDQVKISEERKRELSELAQRPDSEIDFSDIPEATESFWRNARPLAEVLRERRSKRGEQVTLNLDPDVIAWLKRDNEAEYEARLNEVLRQAMETDLGKQRRTA